MFTINSDSHVSNCEEPAWKIKYLASADVVTVFVVPELFVSLVHETSCDDVGVSSLDVSAILRIDKEVVTENVYVVLGKHGILTDAEDEPYCHFPAVANSALYTVLVLSNRLAVLPNRLKFMFYSPAFTSPHPLSHQGYCQ